MLTSAVNISEGRKLDTIHEIASAAAEQGLLLDIHADRDHNRSVLTLAGEPGPLVDAILEASARAVELIDMSLHSGAHPRIGAIDVVPFVPFPTRDGPTGTQFASARDAATSCAQRLWHELGIPCFLYEMSCSKTGRDPSLPAIRREAFKDRMPDVGSTAPHPTAGAAVVGARRILVAYNVNLDIEDLPSARRIAAALRAARIGRDKGSGSVRSLALALPARGLAQVSCNLLEPEVVTVADVFDAVCAMAESMNAEVLGSELVGLVPQAALGGRIPQSLGLWTQPKLLEECVLQARRQGRPKKKLD